MARRLLLILLILWGAVAGLRTVADFDLGWQMADSLHPWASTDQLSYTAHGARWIYPPLAGFIFRGFFHLGGYAAISWLCDAALFATLLIAAWASSTGTVALLLLVVPTLSAQMIPRSGLFTVVLAAAFARVLFGETPPRWRWLLPGLMVLWVNLHQGFVAGLVLVAGFLCTTYFEQRRMPAQTFSWVFATVAATLINPWCFGIYRDVWAQERPTTLQAATVLELQPLYRAFAWQRLNPITAEGAIWWLIAAALAACVLLLHQRRVGMGLFLAGATAVCLLSARSQGVYVPLACVIAGPTLAQALQQTVRRRWLLTGAASLMVAGVTWACWLTVTNRLAVREDAITSFGAGRSWWLPEDAAAFLASHALPQQLFSSFNLSGYLTWRLPGYRDFADARYLPFGDALIRQQLHLEQTPLDAPEWSAAAQRYGIRTILLPLSRFYGLGAVPLHADCESRTWTPVYLDTQAIVFVRNDALPPGIAHVDCATQDLTRDNGGTGIERYQQLANAAVLLYVLGREQDAARALAQAPPIFRGDDSMQLLAGQIAPAQGRDTDAETNLLAAIKLHGNKSAWYQLGLLYARERRWSEAAGALKQAGALRQ